MGEITKKFKKLSILLNSLSLGHAPCQPLLSTMDIEGDFMTRKYDPRKNMYKIWKICSNPLKLDITHESNNGRYVLADNTRLYARILDLNEETIYAATYILNVLKFGGPWHKYAGDQAKKKELLSKVKTIWYTDNQSKEFNIAEYEQQEK